MNSVFDVNATELIEEMTKDLKQNKNIVEPSFIPFVKSGRHKERAPLQKDWYFRRMASILYRVYVDGPVGTESLRSYYGGRKNRGVKPHKKFKAGGKIVRGCLQALEKEGLVEKEKKGRKITAKGQAYLNKKAKELLKKNKK